MLTGRWTGEFTSPVSSVCCVLAYQSSLLIGLKRDWIHTGVQPRGLGLPWFQDVTLTPPLHNPCLASFGLTGGQVHPRSFCCVPNPCRALRSQAMLQDWPKVLWACPYPLTEVLCLFCLETWKKCSWQKLLLNGLVLAHKKCIYRKRFWIACCSPVVKTSDIFYYVPSPGKRVKPAACCWLNKSLIIPARAIQVSWPALTLLLKPLLQQWQGKVQASCLRVAKANAEEAACAGAPEPKPLCAACREPGNGCGAAAIS